MNGPSEDQPPKGPRPETLAASPSGGIRALERLASALRSTARAQEEQNGLALVRLGYSARTEKMHRFLAREFHDRRSARLLLAQPACCTECLDDWLRGVAELRRENVGDVEQLLANRRFVLFAPFVHFRIRLAGHVLRRRLAPGRTRKSAELAGELLRNTGRAYELVSTGG